MHIYNRLSYKKKCCINNQNTPRATWPQIHDENTYVKGWTQLLAIREVQNKPQCTLHPPMWIKWMLYRRWWEWEAQNLPAAAGTVTLQNTLAASHKVEHIPDLWLSSSTRAICLREMKTYVPTKSITSALVAALFVWAKNWKPLKCSFLSSVS